MYNQRGIRGALGLLDQDSPKEPDMDQAYAIWEGIFGGKGIWRPESLGGKSAGYKCLKGQLGHIKGPMVFNYKCQPPGEGGAGRNTD